VSDTRRALAAFAERQYGVFTRHQALAVGLTRHQIDDGVRTGRFERIGEGVYRAAGTPASWYQRLAAAVLAGGPDALTSHRSAAFLWDLDGSRPGIVEITVPRHRRPRRRDGVRVHESTDLDLAAATVRQHTAVTGLVRTLIDLAGVVPRERLGQAVDDAIRRRLTDWDEIAAVRARHARRGRNGTGKMRELLEERYGSTIPDSHFGRLVADLLVDYGLPAPEIEYDVHAADGRWLARVDLAYPDDCLAVELDSAKHHLNEQAFEADPARQNKVELEGWTMLRYTWKAYSRQPQIICAEVAAALRRRSTIPILRS
jgi:predicted transcriptional regulator of viral defense system